MILLLLACAATAPPADTVRLGPGVHLGPLALTQRTVLLGAPGAVLRGNGRGTVLEIRAPGSIVRGLRIENSGRNPDAYDAGVRVAADSVVLEHLEIRDVLFGVYLDEVRGVIVRHVDIAGRAAERESERGDGITLYHSRGVQADSNRISHVRDGIYFSYSDSVRVTGNHVTRVRFGLHYMFSHENSFAGNVFTDNAAGAVIMNSRAVTVRDNVFAWNAGSRSFGLVLQQAAQPRIEGNLLVGNGIGVFFDNVIGGVFSGNLVAANWLGMQLFANSEATRIAGNAFVGNTFDASGGGVAGAYTTCVAGRGNFWDASGATSYDLTGDGVLDVPHAASSALAELALRRETLRLLLHSPAARVLEWAERALPVFDAGGLVDSCPLAAPPVRRPAALASLPAAPAAGHRATEAGTHGQQAASVALVGLGLVVLVTRRRGRWGGRP